MNFCNERRPSFPIGSSFLESWVIEKPIYCLESQECYEIKGASGILLGVAIRCETRQIAELERDRHLIWWEHTTRAVSHEISTLGAWHIVVAAILERNVVWGNEEDALFTEDEARSLLNSLLNVSKFGFEHNVKPLLKIGTVPVIRNGLVSAKPLFVLPASEKTQQDCVIGIAKTVYWFTTKIVPSSSEEEPLPEINRWNPTVGRTFSSLIKDSLNGITSLAELEKQLEFLAVRDDPEENFVVNRLTKNKLSPSDSVVHGLDKVGGMKSLKTLLREEVVRPIREPELFKQYGLSIPNGILLYGPPGCGKTFIARQLAEELGFNFIEVTPSEIASSYIHASVLKIRDLFLNAEKHAPCVIFIDEFEALVPSRTNLGGHQQYKSEEVNEFLVRLNECKGKNILIMAATNEPSLIDDAIKRTGRLDKLIFVGPPDFDARIELLKIYLADRPLGQVHLEEFSQQLEGYSCSDIRNICDEAARLALKQQQPIETEHVKDSIKRNPPSLTPDILAKYADSQQRGI